MKIRIVHTFYGDTYKQLITMMVTQDNIFTMYNGFPLFKTKKIEPHQRFATSNLTNYTLMTNKQFAHGNYIRVLREAFLEKA